MSANLELVVRTIDKSSVQLKDIRDQLKQVGATADQQGKALGELQQRIQSSLSSAGLSGKLSGELAAAAAARTKNALAIETETKALSASGIRYKDALAIVQQFHREQDRAAQNKAGGGGGFLGNLGLDGEGPARAAAALLGVGLGLNVAATAAAKLHDGLAATLGVELRFGAELAGIQAVSGATAAEMAKVAQEASTVGVQFGIGATKTAEGVQELIKGGISVRDALNGATEATLTLAAAGGVTLAQSAEISATALNSFGLQAKDLARVADLVAGAANASSIGVDDVRQSLAQAGSVARTAGVSFDDTARAIALFGQQGLRGSDAGTSLKTLLERMVPTTSEATVVFQRLGLITTDGANRFFDAAGRLKSLSDVSEELKRATAGLTEQQKLANLQIAFGTDAVRAASILAREGAQGFDELARSMDKVKAADVARTRLNSLQGDLDKLKASAEGATVKVGQLADGPLRAGVGALTAYGNALQGVLDRLAHLGELDPKSVAILTGIATGNPGLAVQASQIKTQEPSPGGQSNDSSFQQEQADNRAARPSAVDRARNEANQQIQNAISAAQLKEADAQRELSRVQIDQRRSANEAQLRQLDLEDELSGKKQQSLQLQHDMLEPQQQQLKLERDLADAVDRTRQLRLEGTQIAAQQAALPANRALQDSNDEEKRLQLQAAAIQAKRRLGEDVSGQPSLSDIRKRMRQIELDKTAHLEPSAFDANQRVQAAQRNEEDASLAGRAAQIPIEIKKVALDRALQRQADDKAGVDAAIQKRTLEAQIAEEGAHGADQRTKQRAVLAAQGASDAAQDAGLRAQRDLRVLNTPQGANSFQSAGGKSPTTQRTGSTVTLSFTLNPANPKDLAQQAAAIVTAELEKAAEEIQSESTYSPGRR